MLEGFSESQKCDFANGLPNMSKFFSERSVLALPYLRCRSIRVGFAALGFPLLQELRRL